MLCKSCIHRPGGCAGLECLAHLIASWFPDTRHLSIPATYGVKPYFKIIRAQCPALMIAPSSTDLAEAPGEARFHETELPGQVYRGLVPRLNVCLNAMQLQFLENMTQH